MINIEQQQELANKHMSSTNCRGCIHYKYLDNKHTCLFNSSPVDSCNIVQLYLKGNLYAKQKN